MNINGVASYQNQPNFEARIKLKAPNTKALLQSAIGTTAIGAGTLSLADAGLSAVASWDPNGSAYQAVENLGEIPKAVLEAHNEALTSAAGRYDNAGYAGGIPVQSTVLPGVLASSGLASSTGGTNATSLASGDNIDATTFATSNASGQISVNKNIQKTIVGSGYLATAAGSLYSGFADVDNVNEILPKPMEFEQDCDSKQTVGISGGASIGIPMVSAVSAGLSKASDTTSSAFVSGTLQGKDSSKDKKLPS